MNAGNKGIKYHISCCAFTIPVKFREPAHSTTEIIIKPIETSYEIICAAARIAPKKAYFELLDHPDNNKAYTLTEETANKYNIPILISAITPPSLYGITAQLVKARVKQITGDIIKIPTFE